MSCAIISAGIYLPNGNFISNSGDGHIKNAQRILNKYPEIYCLMNLSSDLADDFVIQCGFAIVACYHGKWCFKVANDNPFFAINELTKEYEKIGIEIWKYWDINKDYLKRIQEIHEIIEKVECKFEYNSSIPNLHKKVGFILDGYWYPNIGGGHEKNARGLIFNHNWESQWLNNNATAQDFIVLNKGAIQLGSGVYNQLVIASSKFYRKTDLEIIMRQYKLETSKYRIVLY